MFDYSGLHSAEFSAFGDKAIFHLASGDVELDVIFRDRSDTEHLAKNLQIADHNLLIDVLTSDVTTHQITTRQTVTVRGGDYQIIKANQEETADGMTVFDIRKYRA